MQREPYSPAVTCANRLRVLIASCVERETLLRSVKTALVVGSILALVNHGQQLLSEQFSPTWMIPMLVTYLVPFFVATYGQVQGKRQRDRARPGRPEQLHRAIEGVDGSELADLDTSLMPAVHQRRARALLCPLPKRL